MTNDLNETTRIVNLPMAHIVYGPPPAKPATKRNWFWAAAVLGASLWGFSGCGDNNAPELPADCNVSPSAVVAHQDCGGVALDGYRCFEGCGVTDFSGGPGPAPKLVGCLTGQAETTMPAICVASCSECH